MKEKFCNSLSNERTLGQWEKLPIWSSNCQQIGTMKTLIRNESDKSVINFFINEKFKKIFYLFTCILPIYMPHEITKEF